MNRFFSTAKTATVAVGRISTTAAAAANEYFLWRQQKKEEIQQEKLHKMTLQERESILHDIHGVSNDVPIEESSPELISKSLSDFITLIRQEEANIMASRGPSSSSSSALEIALATDPTYIYSNTSFLLLFLRAENFNLLLSLERLKKFSYSTSWTCSVSKNYVNVIYITMTSYGTKKIR